MINTVYHIKTCQEYVALINLFRKRGYDIHYNGTILSFVEVNHIDYCVHFSHKAELVNKIVASTFTEFVTRL